MDQEFKVGDKVLHKSCQRCVERIMTVSHKRIENRDGTVWRDGLILEDDRGIFFAWLDVVRDDITPYES